MYEETQMEKTFRKLKRLEEMLHDRMFIPVDQVEMSVWTTKKPVHEVPDRAMFSPCEKGRKWLEEGLYCWFLGDYTIPEKLAGQTLFIFPKIKGYEGMLWVDKKPYGNFTSKVIQNSYGYHYCDLLTKGKAAGEQLEIALEYYSHHYVRGTQPFEESDEVFEIAYDHVDICVKDEIVCNFFYDLHIVNQMAESLSKEQFRRGDAVRALLRVHEIIDYDIDLADPVEWHEKAQKADAVLQKVLSDHNGPHAGFAGLIGHSHMDTAWLWHLDETVEKCARTYANQLSLMDQYPDYKFIQSSAVHTSWMEQYYPAIFEGMKKRIAEGRYEPNGGVWVECDCNIPGGEFMVRQFLWGQRYTMSRFNYHSNCFWLPDTFGYSAALPQIMKGCGVDYFLTTKMAWGDTNEFPYDTFYWEGIDGTRVFTHTNRTHIWPDAQQLLECVNGCKGYGIKDKNVTDSRLLSYGFGDGGGGPEFEMVEIANRLKDVEGLPRTEHIRVGDFMQKLEKESFRPSVYAGELYLELHRGTLTNQHRIKRNNRKAEIAIRNLEYMTVLSALQSGKKISGEAIAPLTGLLLLNQFHDILPGTCIPRVHDESLAQTGHVIEEATKQTTELLADMAEETDAADSTEHAFRTLYNTLSFDRSDVVYVPVEKDSHIGGEYAQQIVEKLDGQDYLAVDGLNLPAFGSRSVELSDGAPVENADCGAVASSAETSAAVPFVLDGDHLQTPFYDVIFDERGYISSLIDRENGRQLKGEGYALNTFLVAEDVPDSWDNWDLDADIADKWRDCAKLLSRSVVSCGAVELRIRSEYQLTKKSSLQQDMVFYSKDRKIGFETVMNWQDDHRFLKAAFDTSVQSRFARNEVQFGYIERATYRNTSWEKAKFEVSNHKYTDLSEPGYGVAVLNDCKYGVSVENGRIWLSLHKGGCRPDYRGDKGIHECTYALLPHNSGFGAEAVVQPAYELNIAPIVMPGKKELESFVTVDAPNVIVEAVKPMEDGNGYALRLYEAEGTSVRTKIHLTETGEKVMLTNLLEEEIETLPDEKEIALEFKPFEIKTICVLMK